MRSQLFPKVAKIDGVAIYHPYKNVILTESGQNGFINKALRGVSVLDSPFTVRTLVKEVCVLPTPS
jgi:hypothetical protein